MSDITQGIKQGLFENWLKCFYVGEQCLIILTTCWMFGGMNRKKIIESLIELNTIVCKYVFVQVSCYTHPGSSMMMTWSWQIKLSRWSEITQYNRRYQVHPIMHCSRDYSLWDFLYRWSCGAILIKHTKNARFDESCYFRYV